MEKIMKMHNDRNSRQFAPPLEGIISADDGPQSVKEELELSREELLELNNKLAAHNAGLQARLAEMSRANNEMKDALKENEQRFRMKLESIQAPDGDIGNL